MPPAQAQRRAAQQSNDQTSPTAGGPAQSGFGNQFNAGLVQAAAANSSGTGGKGGAPTAPNSSGGGGAGDGGMCGGGGGGGGAATHQEGSAIVAAESGQTEYGFTNRFTPDIVQMLQSDPKANLDDVLRTIGDQEYQVNYTDDATFPQPELHPTIAEYGERTDKNSSGTKKATLIANENYPNAVLQGVTGQATSLEGQLSSRGYVSSGVVTDKNAADMGAAWNGMVNGAQPGDELVAYFIGHGGPDGLCGIDWSNFSNSQVAGVVSAATSKGAHVRFLIDACHAGGAAQAVREERMNELDTRTDDPIHQALLSLARQVSGFRQKLLDHVNARHTALGQIQAAITQHTATPVPADPAAAASHATTATALQSAFVMVQQAYDAKIDQTWAEARAFFEVVSIAFNMLTDTDLDCPDTVTDHGRLGDQIDFMDNLINAALAPVERDVGTEAIP